MRSLLRFILRNWLGKVDNFYSMRYLQKLKQKLRKLQYNKSKHFFFTFLKTYEHIFNLQIYFQIDIYNFRKYDSVFKTPNQPDVIDRIVTDLFEKKEDENISYASDEAVVLSEKEDVTVDEIESLLGSDEPTTTTTTRTTPTTTTRVTPTTTTMESTNEEEKTRPRLVLTKTRVGFKPNNWSKFLQRFKENETSDVKQRMISSKFTKLDNFLNRLNKD